MLTIKAILDSKAGKAATAFLRVAAATAFGAWAAAGFPFQVTGSDLEAYIRAGLAAGAALVGVNSVAPWETRYGRGSNPVPVAGAAVHRALLELKRQRGGKPLGLD